MIRLSPIQWAPAAKKKKGRKPSPKKTTRRKKGKEVAETISPSQVEVEEIPTTTTTTTTESTPHTFQPPPGEPKPTNLSDLIQFKAAFTAPFMFYDESQKKIVKNPQYQRPLISDLALLQSVVLTHLGPVQEAASNYTPKELLYHLSRALLFVVTSSFSFQAESKSTPFSFREQLVLSDAHLKQNPQPVWLLEYTIAHRCGSAESCAAVGYVLSEGLSKSGIEKFLTLLKERINGETRSEQQKRRTPEQRKALSATQQGTEEVGRILHNLRQSYDWLRTESQSLRGDLSPADLTSLHTAVIQGEEDATELEGNQKAAALLRNEYYNLLQWVLGMYTERTALPSTPVHRSSGVQVTEYDPTSGRLVLERSDTQQRWGLTVNQLGCLVGLENNVKYASEEAKALTQVLQSGESGGGLAILEVNRHRVRKQFLSPEELREKQEDIMKKLSQILMNEAKTSKTLHLVVERVDQSLLSAVREVHSEFSPQGNENSGGQQVLLVLRRPSASVKWGLKIRFGDSDYPLLEDITEGVHLSDTMKNFLFEHRLRLRMLHINNESLRGKASAGEVAHLLQDTLVTIRLQVLPPEVSEEAAAVAEGLEEEIEEVETEEKEVHEEEEAEEPAKITGEGEEEEEELEGISEETEEKEAELTEDGKDFVDEEGNQFESVEAANEAHAKAFLREGEEEEDEADDGEEVEEGGEEEEKEDAKLVENPEEEYGALLEKDEEDLEVEGNDWADTSKQNRIYGDKKVTDERAAAMMEEEEEERGIPDRLEEGEEEVEEGGEVEEVEGEEDAAKEIAPEEIDDINASVQKMVEGIDENTPVEKIEKSTRKKKTPAKKAASKKSKKKKPSPKKSKKDKKSKKTKKSEMTAAEEEEGDTAEAEEVTPSLSKETPVIDSKTTAEVIIDETAKQKKKAKAPKKGAKEAVESTTTENDNAAPIDRSISKAILMEAKPIELKDHRQIKSFDGETLELTRPSVGVSWEVNMKHDGEHTLLSGLPKLGDLKHPFVQSLGVQPTGKLSQPWRVEAINGKDISLLGKKDSMKALQALKNATSIKFLLRRR